MSSYKIYSTAFHHVLVGKIIFDSVYGVNQYSRFIDLGGSDDKFLRYSVSLTGNMEDGEDLLQDSTFKALRSISSLKNESAFESWFYQLIRNTYIDTKRSRKALEVSGFGCDLADCHPTRLLGTSSDYIDPELMIIQQCTAEAVWHGIKQLSSTHAQVIILHYMEAYSVPEIAHCTGSADGTVRSRISRALQRLREILSNPN